MAGTGDTRFFLTITSQGNLQVSALARELQPSGHLGVVGESSTTIRSLHHG